MSKHKLTQDEIFHTGHLKPGLSPLERELLKQLKDALDTIDAVGSIDMLAARAVVAKAEERK